MNSTSILKFLDERFERIEMPCFSNMNIDYVTSRLSVYTADPSSWIILFNSVVWCPAADGLMGMIEVVGPGVIGRQGFDNDRITSPGVIESDESDESILSVEVRGAPIDLDQLNIEPQLELQAEGGFWAAVALLPNYRESLLASPQELEQFIPQGFKQVLQLEEWDHPDFDRPPSETETFPALSAAIASGDFRSVEASSRPNTHWSHWLPK